MDGFYILSKNELYAVNRGKGNKDTVEKVKIVTKVVPGGCYRRNNYD